MTHDEIVEFIASFCDCAEEGGKRPLRQEQRFVFRGGREDEKSFERSLHLREVFKRMPEVLCSVRLFGFC